MKPVELSFANKPLTQWLTRLAWISIAMPLFMLSLAGIPFRYTQLLLQNQWFHNELGLRTSPEQAALVVLLLEMLVGSVFFLTGAAFAWLKSTDRIGVVLAFALLAMAGTFPGMTDAVIDTTMTTQWLSWAWFIYSLRALSSGLNILLFYMLPDGRFVPSWTRKLALIWVALCVIWLLFPQAPFSVVYGESFRATETASILLISAWWMSGILALVLRYRGTDAAAQRQQIKWVAAGMFLAGLGNISYLFIRPLHTALGFSSDLYVIGRTAISSILFICLPVCITIAVFRYRLWQIDLLINRTLVYGSLTGATVGFYILMVSGVGSLMQNRANAVIAFVATGIVAVIFQPLRLRLQTVVDRLMYGQRDDPVGMLTRLAQRLETVADPKGLLPTLVETIAKALKLPYTAIWLPQSDHQWEPAAVYGKAVDDLQMIPLLYQSEEVGRLFVARRGPGEPFSHADEQLLATIALLAATTVRAAQLTLELQHSRREIVTGREEERRRLRRDLHDGLGPALASIALQADTARELVKTNPEETDQILIEITNEAQNAVEDIRRLVYGLRPPALDELGLVKALRQSVHTIQMQVSIEAPNPIPALPAAVEAAAYRIAQEAINNAARHGRAKTCTVTVQAEGALNLTIRDDGAGLPADAPIGVGLISMRERAAELGGTLRVQSAPGEGTLIEARFPLD